MDLLMRALAQNIDQSLSTARELKLDTVEQLLTMASLELSARQKFIDSEPQPGRSAPCERRRPFLLVNQIKAHRNLRGWRIL